MKVALWLLAALVLMPHSRLQAQEPPQEMEELPREVAEEILDFVNASATLRTSGRVRIPSEASVSGDAASVGGPYFLAGLVQGDLVVVNGDLTLEPGARVTGDIIVLGGRLTGWEEAQVDGTITLYRVPLSYSLRGDELVYRPPDPSPPHLLAGDLPFGTARVTFRAASNYSRTEGLPILFGPLLETAGSNPFLLEAFGIWRSTSGLSGGRDELGFRFRAEQTLGGRREFALGALRYSEIQPVEDWILSNPEASLATFLLRRDYRDYYDRDGWAAYFRYRPEGSPVELSAEFREEEHTFAPIRNPWTLGDDQDPWRPQPTVARGEFRSVGVSLALDTRNDLRAPSDGWLVDARLRRGVGGNLMIPVLTPEPGEAMPTVASSAQRRVDASLTTGHLDARRYLRLGPATRLALRGLWAGALSEDPLPPQLQHALGGEGSLPGHRRFRGDCGARSVLFRNPEEADELTFGAYGCDRIGLLQVELQRGLDQGWDLLPDEWGNGEAEWEWASLLRFRPRWSLFFNVGKGSVQAEDGFLGVLRQGTPTLADAGAGLFLGPLGLYWAAPVTERDRGVNFFVRLHHRF